MMTHPDSAIDIAQQELQGEVCVCAGRKKSGESFCRRCYFTLPGRMRQALYRAFSSGYVEAYDEAKEFLKTLD